MQRQEKDEDKENRRQCGKTNDGRVLQTDEKTHTCVRSVLHPRVCVCVCVCVAALVLVCCGLPALPPVCVSVSALAHFPRLFSFLVSFLLENEKGEHEKVSTDVASLPPLSKSEGYAVCCFPKGAQDGTAFSEAATCVIVAVTACA